jgi:mannose-6-phosphate isomerase-like protein (cupin superfamily)
MVALVRSVALSLLFVAGLLPGADRRPDPTFIRRSLSNAPERPGEYAAPGVKFKLLAGMGDPDTHVMKGLARFGQLTVEPGASTASVILPGEEQAILVTEGKGVLRYPDGEHGVRRGDFLYIPLATRYSVSNTSDESCRMIVMGFRVRGEHTPPAVPKLLIENLENVKKQVVGNHPVSTLYQLMIGDRKSTRDAIAAGRVLTSLYVMEFAPGGTNLPHHHETEEEAYLMLDGEGQMVAGSGTDGIEGRYPVKAGDAYFFRLNCTVGFYSAPKGGKTRVLAVRWLFPFSRRGE